MYDVSTQGVDERTSVHYYYYKNLSTFGVTIRSCRSSEIHGRERRRLLNQLQDHTWSDRNVDCVKVNNNNNNDNNNNNRWRMIPSKI